MPQRLIAVVAAALFSVALAHGAPSTSAQSIPGDILTVLTRGAIVDQDAEVRAGPPAGGFPADLLPPGATIAASAESRVRGTTVVAVVRQAVTRQAEDARLQQAGWTASTPFQRGFVRTVADIPGMVCRQSEFATLSWFARPDGSTYVRANVTHDVRRPCAAIGLNFFSDVPLPPLYPPADAPNAFPTGTSSNADSFLTSARIETSAKIATLVRHYVGQLTAAGWKVIGHASDASFSVTRLAATSTHSEAVTAVLTVLRTEDTQYEMSLRLLRDEPDPRRLPPTATSLTPIR